MVFAQRKQGALIFQHSTLIRPVDFLQVASSIKS
jgi:hypothetical protein